MKIAVRRGHQRTGQDGCATGIVNEINVAEGYYKIVIQKLKDLGHEVLDVTPPEENRTLSNSLMYGINKANEWGADLFISCHVNNAYNSYDGTIGCEVIYHSTSTKGKEYAIKVEKELSNIGFKSRGAKADIRGLAELKYTNMPCIIVEPFFVEATGDVENYRKVRNEGIANAIVKGVCGKLPSENKPKPDAPKLDHTIPDNKYVVWKSPNGLGYIESIPEKGRLIIHLDKYNYLNIQDDEKEGNRVWVATRTKGSKNLI